MRKIYIVLSVFLILITFVSCGQKQTKQPPIDFSQYATNVIKIKFDDRNNNQIWIPVKLNGVSMDMLYDTGFNGTVSMSLLELQTMAKQGRFSERDVCARYKLFEYCRRKYCRKWSNIDSHLAIGGEFRIDKCSRSSCIESRRSCSDRKRSF